MVPPKSMEDTLVHSLGVCRPLPPGAKAEKKVMKVGQSLLGPFVEHHLGINTLAAVSLILPPALPVSIGILTLMRRKLRFTRV